MLQVSPFKRTCERHAVKKHGSLIVNNHDRHLQRHACLIVEVSRGGFRVRGSFRLKRGQVVEVVSNDDPLSIVKCNVVWVGNVNTAQQGEVGLEATN